ncbi:MAG: HEAT repeat domain-containing protein [Thermodesulfobacteriota bacterium]
MATDHHMGDEEMIQVIADFLEQGLVGNIVSMFKADTNYYPLVGEVLKDERFAVRLGVAVLFEELKEERPQDVAMALPALTPLLDTSTPAYVRGEVVSIIGTIGTSESLELLKPLVKDPDPQVAEIARDFVGG